MGGRARCKHGDGRHSEPRVTPETRFSSQASAAAAEHHQLRSRGAHAHASCPPYPVGISDLERPLSGDLTALAARDQYLAENGFTTASYDAKGSKVTVFGVDF